MPSLDIKKNIGNTILSPCIYIEPTAPENGLFYFFTDHLGSTTLLTDETGNPLPDTVAHYLPFSSYRSTPPDPALTDRGFTGHKHNNDLGLVYMNARYYIPSIARFLSADTLVPDPTNPQGWNRYSYTLNNPLKYVDPSGHCWSFASGLRNTFFSTTCNNMDMAWSIVTSPDASVGERALAATYLTVETISAGTVVVGSTAATVGCLTGAGTVVCAGASSAATVVSADGDPTNEINTIGNGVANSSSTLERGLNFFRNFTQGQGFSVATDIKTGQSALLPSTPTLTGPQSEIVNGVKWVAQYGGHEHVKNELVALGSEASNVWGYVTRWTGNSLEIFNWNSGTINRAIQGTITVPIEIRSQIVNFLSTQTGLRVIDLVTPQ